jgi:hypothetical protein
MSHVALQRVVVRMLHDAAFARAVLADSHAATREIDLDDAERRWLVAPDPRAYEVDPLRRSRGLTGLIEEYAVSSALLVRARGRDRASTALDAYFSSSAFHWCVQSGGSLADSFGTWLLSAESPLEDAHARSIAEIERAIVRARRARELGPAWPITEREVENSCVVLAPGVVVELMADGASARCAAALHRLRAHPHGLMEGVLDPDHPLPTVESGAERAGVIVDGRREDVRLEATSAELARVLAHCAEPIAFETFVAAGDREGATRQDCLAIVASFAEDGILLLVEHS